MDPDAFDDEEWQFLLDELRMLVVRAGFADWDSAMAQCLTEPDEETAPVDALIAPSPHTQLRNYTERFMRFLKVDSAWARERRRETLGSLVQTPDGLRAEGAVVATGGLLVKLDTGPPTDAMIETLGRFLDMIGGGPDNFMRDEPGELT